jgi:RNA polymerase sigma-70 factor, ECF subfamily
VTTEANRAIERIARLSYGKLVALLAARTRNFAGADDALAEALMRAVEKWPTQGVPANPEGWLMTTAKRLIVDGSRSARVAGQGESQLLIMIDEREQQSNVEIEDERLKLLFVCAHPAIDERDRTPLMLQTVLGLDARRIASAFLMSPGTMGQRLVRAKLKIEHAGIAFELPNSDTMHDRLESVLAAIYAAYTLGWNNSYTDDLKTNGLADEAIWLGSLVAQLMPHEAEAIGLFSLMLFCESRRQARRGKDGAYTALGIQDCSLWNSDMLADAERALRAAGRLAKPGRYQIEAAIQAVHSARRTTNVIDWKTISLLYSNLTAISPSIGALTAAASATAEASGMQAGLDALDAVPFDLSSLYQPWWAVRAHLLEGIGDMNTAAECYETAAGLSEDQAVRTFLLQKRAKILS